MLVFLFEDGFASVLVPTGGLVDGGLFEFGEFFAGAGSGEIEKS